MRVQVSGHKFNFPHQCVCCGATPETTWSVSASRSTGKKVVHTTSKSWDIPYCRRCVEHVHAARRAVRLGLTTFLLLFVVAIVLGINGASGASTVVIICSSLGGPIVYWQLLKKAKTLCMATCAEVGIAVGYSGWQNTCHTFEIASSNYARSFMIANLSKLVNIRPDALEWLRTNGHLGSPHHPQSARRKMS
jgi:hypothetical protein